MFFIPALAVVGFAQKKCYQFGSFPIFTNFFLKAAKVGAPRPKKIVDPLFEKFISLNDAKLSLSFELKERQFVFLK
jgi:hypothetical protein